jgi:hypothetical protein
VEEILTCVCYEHGEYELQGTDAEVMAFAAESSQDAKPKKAYWPPAKTAIKCEIVWDEVRGQLDGIDAEKCEDVAQRPLCYSHTLCPYCDTVSFFTRCLHRIKGSNS